MSDKPIFPAKFLWGASCSAYQVDGGDTQWRQWEQRHAQELTREIPRRFPAMPHQDRLQGLWDDPQNYIAGDGIEHAMHYEADFDILRQLNMNAFRFGIEWAKLEPAEGTWDEAAIDHYRRYIQALQDRGIEPVLTLWHWTMPTWFTAKGGFEKRANIGYFERYAAKVMQEFGCRLKYVLTLNEPNVYTAFGYGSGDWPPSKKRPLLLYRVYRNLTEAHRRVYRAIKTTYPAVQVGLPMNLGDIRPVNPRNPVNLLTCRLLGWLWNWWFLNQIRQQQDFIGINYYFTEYRTWRGAIRNPAGPVSDLGWYMEPRRLEAVITATWRRYRVPIMITENGLADRDDAQRQWWLQETIDALAAALQNGIPVAGYLHWSLLDNFEWAFGWWPRFGLVAVDRKQAMKRTVRPSAVWFGRQIAAYRKPPPA